MQSRGADGGHLRLEVEAKGDFLEVSRHVVTDEDFIGSYYQVEYVIRKEKLKKGRQFGEITVKSPYQQLTYQSLHPWNRKCSSKQRFM